MWCYRFFLCAGVLLADCAFADNFIFQPVGSQFSVTFPGSPVVSQYHSGEGNSCVTHDAILEMLDGRAGLRAESTVCTVYDTSAVFKEDLMQTLRGHAEVSGVTDAAYQVEDTEFGLKGTYRGILPSIGSTFVYVTILGKESAMSLVGSAPYRDFPLINFQLFAKSLQPVDKEIRESGQAASEPNGSKSGINRVTFRVSLSVSADEMQNMIESNIRRELQKISDVVVTDDNSHYVIRLIVVDVKIAYEQQLGYAIATLVEDPFNTLVLPGLITNEKERETVALATKDLSEVLYWDLRVSSDSRLLQDIAEIVADFDIEALKPARETLRRAMERMERIKQPRSHD